MPILAALAVSDIAIFCAEKMEEILILRDIFFKFLNYLINFNSNFIIYFVYLLLFVLYFIFIFIYYLFY
jgi:hypothetical protein